LPFLRKFGLFHDFTQRSSEQLAATDIRKTGRRRRKRRRLMEDVCEGQLMYNNIRGGGRGLARRERGTSKPCRATPVEGLLVCWRRRRRRRRG